MPFTIQLAALLYCCVFAAGSQVAILSRRPSVAVKAWSERFVREFDLHKSWNLDLEDFKKGLIADINKRNGKVGQDVGLLYNDCADSLVTLAEDFAKFEPYAVRMFDSWGKIPSGLAQGNLHWMGRYYECMDSRAKNFSGKYFEMTAGFPYVDNGVATTLVLATCLPNTCKVEDAEVLFQPLANLTNHPIHAYHPKQPNDFDTIDIVASVVCLVLCFAVLCGTIYELCLSMTRYSVYDELFQDGEELAPNSHKTSGFSKIVLSFSAIKNTEAILDTTQKEGNINALHGLRFISMTWVILGHTFLTCISSIDNPVDYAKYYVTHGTFQAIGNAYFSVDTFFFIGGLLASYLGLRELDRRKGRLSVFKAYLYRYLRLTPAYALCILLTVSLYSKIGDGPAWPSFLESVRKPCQIYWWTNLLYINNVHPNSLEDECFTWGWYLANDMQFFLLSPFIILLLYRRPRLGMFALACGTIISISVTASLSAHYKEPPTAVGFAQTCAFILNIFQRPNATASDAVYLSNVTTTPAPPSGPTQADILFSDIYAKPWCRLGVYLIGTGTGYILHAKQRRINMNIIFVAFMWIVVGAASLTIVYGLWGYVHKMETMSNASAAAYNAISRPAWALCLTWIVIACVNGYGGPIDKFLSWKAFIPLSRLTYCAYLLHPLIIAWEYNTQEVLMHFSVTEIAIHFVAFVGLSYSAAYILSVTVEMPMIGILKAMFKETNEKTVIQQLEDDYPKFRVNVQGTL